MRSAAPWTFPAGASLLLVPGTCVPAYVLDQLTRVLRQQGPEELVRNWMLARNGLTHRPIDSAVEKEEG